MFLPHREERMRLMAAQLDPALCGLQVECVWRLERFHGGESETKKPPLRQTEVYQPGDLCLLVLLVRGLFLFAVLTCPFFMYGSGD